MKVISFYDTKPCDRDVMQAAEAAVGLEFRFHEFRLTTETAATAAGSDAVCVFVNDKLDRRCLSKLSEAGVKHVALRCAGFNQVDLVAARELGMAVTRVPAYSPHAVAEHTLALLLTLNRKIHRAYIACGSSIFLSPGWWALICMARPWVSSAREKSGAARRRFSVASAARCSRMIRFRKKNGRRLIKCAT